MHSFSDTNLIAFIDNAEDRMVVEADADWYEERFKLYDDMANGFKTHLGLVSNWKVARVEYTGDTYIITFERLWV